MSYNADYWEIGVDENRHVVKVPFNKHALLAGTTGAGKSGVLMLPLRWAALARLEGANIDVWLGDPPSYMTSMHPLVQRVAVTPKEHKQMWEDVRAEYERRKEIWTELGRKGQMVEELGPQHGVTRLIIVQDETSSIIRDCAKLTQGSAGPNGKPTSYNLSVQIQWCLQNVRKAGIYILLADQDPKDGNLPSTAKQMLETRIGLRAGTYPAARTVYDDRVNEAPLHLLPADRPGRCFVMSKYNPKPTETQAYYLSPERVGKLMKRVAAWGGQGVGKGVGNELAQGGGQAQKPSISGPAPHAHPEPTQPPKAIQEAAEAKDALAVDVWAILKYADGDGWLSANRINAIRNDRNGISGDRRKAITSALESFGDLVEDDRDGRGWRIRPAVEEAS